MVSLSGKWQQLDLLKVNAGVECVLEAGIRLTGDCERG